jgi:UDP-2-acetamido-2,6-beta-L-arabino-hexul-4-ose reductase
MNLVYIDDVVNELILQLESAKAKYTAEEYFSVSPIYTLQLGDIAELIRSFRDSRSNLNIPLVTDTFTKKLYSTYLSYLAIDQFSYSLKMKMDNRGSFTSFSKLSIVDRFQLIYQNHASRKETTGIIQNVKNFWPFRVLE